jgi:hypothetical protein
VTGYPGLGSALAWDRARRLAAGESLSRSFDIAVADGRLGEAEIAVLADELTRRADQIRVTTPPV